MVVKVYTPGDIAQIDPRCLAGTVTLDTLGVDETARLVLVQWSGVTPALKAAQAQGLDNAQEAADALALARTHAAAFPDSVAALDWVDALEEARDRLEDLEAADARRARHNPNALLTTILGRRARAR